MEIKTDSARPRTSTRDRAELQRQLGEWLAARLHRPVISDIVTPEGTGMSSETVLFDVAWEDDGKTRQLSCVARLPPDPGAMPVFPVYDMERQFRAMQFARDHSDVPVPKTLWYEPDSHHLGASFFVMERANGEAPPDVPPYVFGSWLLSAPREDQQRLQDAAIGILAALHAIDAPDGEMDFLRLDQPGETALRRHVNAQRDYYEWVVSDGIRQPLIERAFDWLEANWPQHDSDEQLSWGDARIGNMLFENFRPTAVLDWEMVATGPREIDLGWMIYLHHFFQDFTPLVNLPGMPEFMRLDAVAATYERLSGHKPRDLEFYTLYAALRHAIVMARIGRRQAHFGESVIPENPDDMIPHHPAIEAMLAGNYWETRR